LVLWFAVARNQATTVLIVPVKPIVKESNRVAQVRVDAKGKTDAQANLIAQVLAAAKEKMGVLADRIAQARVNSGFDRGWP
jgi:hypothetical protein